MIQKITILCIVALLTLSCTTDDSTSPDEQACDNGTFIVDILRLETQQEVNDFGAMCYSKIEGSLAIGVPFDLENDITDLSPLSTLTEIHAPDNATEFAGGLSVYAQNLTSLHGLHNITSITSLRINNCNALTDLSGLGSLQEITGLSATDDNFEGRFSIVDNPQLLSFVGLDNLTSIGQSSTSNFVVEFSGSGFQSLEGLNNISTINGQVILFNLSQITTLEGLNNLQSVRSLRISANANLLNLDGLNNLQSINGALIFGSNPNLLNIDGLSNVLEVQDFITTLDIFPCNGCSPVATGNESLTDFCGFENLFTNGIYQDVEIADNAYNPTVQDIVDGNCSL